MARLDELWYMVSPQNPLKRNADLLDDHLRLEMARLALQHEGNERLKVSDFEFHLPKPSYMITTLNGIREQFPDRQPILLIGEDNWEHFDRWYKSNEIKQNYEIFVYPRLDSTPSNLPLFNVSSTEIRQLIREGKPYRHLIPETVADFIEERHLYQS